MYQTSIRNKKKNSSFNRDKEMNYQLNPDFEEYAFVEKLLGNCRAKVICNNGIQAIGIIRGSLRKFNNRILIENGDIVVVSKRDFQENKVDIVHKFNIEQCQSLVKNKEISEILINSYHNKNYNIPNDEKHIDDNYINFDDMSSDDDKSCDLSTDE
jgi:translation initiation factor 1A